MRRHHHRRGGGVIGRGAARALGPGPVAALALLAAAPATLRADDFVLIQKDLSTEPITLVDLSDRELVHVRADEWHTVALSRCIALYAPRARPAPAKEGLLVLADGQRMPGRAIGAGGGASTLAWHHAWLGRVDVPLTMVRSVRFTETAADVSPGDADVVVLGNGDRQEGFVVALGDPIRLEIDGEDGPRVIDLPLERAAAVAMVTPEQAPRGRRVWFTDGTVIDVDMIAVRDDGFVRLACRWQAGADPIASLRLESVAAILFDPASMMPLAGLDPSEVSGPVTRYRIPPPERLDREAPLGLSRIACRGPLRVRYALPRGASRFAARAVLPPGARRWGDYELILRDDDRMIFTARLDGRNAAVPINVALGGSELTLELTAGRYGPIQDLLVLEHAMLLVGRGDD